MLADTKGADQRAQVYGLVLELGDLCFTDLSGITTQLDNFDIETGGKTGHITRGIGQAWCKVGDTILYHPYSYAQVRDPMTFEYRDDVIIVNDQDVYAVVHNLDVYEEAVRGLQEEDEKEVKKKAESLKSKY